MARLRQKPTTILSSTPLQKRVAALEAAADRDVLQHFQATFRAMVEESESGFQTGVIDGLISKRTARLIDHLAASDLPAGTRRHVRALTGDKCQWNISFAELYGVFGPSIRSARLMEQLRSLAKVCPKFATARTALLKHRAARLAGQLPQAGVRWEAEWQPHDAVLACRRLESVVSTPPPSTPASDDADDTITIQRPRDHQCIGRRRADVCSSPPPPLSLLSSPAPSDGRGYRSESLSSPHHRQLVAAQRFIPSTGKSMPSGDNCRSSPLTSSPAGAPFGDDSDEYQSDSDHDSLHPPKSQCGAAPSSDNCDDRDPDLILLGLQARPKNVRGSDYSNNSAHGASLLAISPLSTSSNNSGYDADVSAFISQHSASYSDDDAEDDVDADTEDGVDADTEDDVEADIEDDVEADTEDDVDAGTEDDVRDIQDPS